MQKLSVVFLWFASLLSFAAPPVPKEFPRLISEQEARNPEFVSQWLTIAGSKADQGEARRFFSLGLRAKESQNWSAASKAFGESMRRYPSPHALFEYAESDLKMLGQVRSRDGFPSKLVREDMAYALGLYEASLAANKVTGTLLPAEAKRIEQYVYCMKNYLNSLQPQSNCQPLEYFSIGLTSR